MIYYNHLPNLILGYHGCEETLAEEILSGSKKLEPSINDYDWLGPGIYFWDSNPDRALSFAKEKKRRGQLKEPFVIGAVLTLGNCIDTLNQNSIRGIKSAYKQTIESYTRAGESLPKNSGGKDLLMKRLDCAVITTLHQLLKEESQPDIDSLRGLYHEGNQLYETSSFYEKSHIQICIVNPTCIKGVFRVE